MGGKIPQGGVQDADPERDDDRPHQHMYRCVRAEVRRFDLKKSRYEPLP